MPLAAIAGTLLLLLDPAGAPHFAGQAVQTQSAHPEQSAEPALPPAQQSSEPQPAPQNPAPSDASTPAPANQAPVPQAPLTQAPAIPAATLPCSTSSVAGSEASPACPPAPSKTKAKKRRRPHQTAGAGSAKKVVRNGGTSDTSVAISPSVSQQQASQQLHTAGLLLAKADANLKTVEARQLSPGQQETVKQIKSYMEQAKAATNSGDGQSAYNLANKARMLSADLVKH